MISLANSHCSKIHSNIKTTHNTQRGKNTKFCLQLLKNGIKNIHIFLKEAFLLLFFFLNPPLQDIWRHFLSSFCVCICRSFLIFYMFFCTRIYHLKQASQALVNVTDMFSFLSHFWFWKVEQAELKSNFFFASVFAFWCLFVLFRFFFSYQNGSQI